MSQKADIAIPGGVLAFHIFGEQLRLRYAGKKWPKEEFAEKWPSMADNRARNFFEPLRADYRSAASYQDCAMRLIESRSVVGCLFRQYVALSFGSEPSAFFQIIQSVAD